jgi:gluconolactonase
MLASSPAPVAKLWTLACLGRAFARGIAVPDSVHTSIIILASRVITGESLRLDFLNIIGDDPSLTLIAATDSDPLFHEAVVWYPPTDEVFFAQNAGAKAAGTGLVKSAIIQKISLAQAEAVSSSADGQVNVTVVNFDPPVINPNGGTNYKGNILFTGQGMGADVAPALYLANPLPPYNTTVLINNFHGRQFNSLNDVAVQPLNGNIYFTDVPYGYLQSFRPSPGLPNQVYKLNPVTKAVTVVADGFVKCNGLTFSPDGKYAYVTDTGPAKGFSKTDPTQPAAIYRFNVVEDGTWDNRKLFAYIGVGVPDGVHCDLEGNVYAGCGDGVHVWNPSGVLLGKIWTGRTVANFQFAGDGRMVIGGETQLYYARVAANGTKLT